MTLAITEPSELFPRENYESYFEVKEFWTASQRQANRLHEVSYRACFKPQLPAYLGTKSKLDLISDWTEDDLSLARKMSKRLTELVVGQSVERA